MEEKEKGLQAVLEEAVEDFSPPDSYTLEAVASSIMLPNVEILIYTVHKCFSIVALCPFGYKLTLDTIKDVSGEKVLLPQQKIPIPSPGALYCLKTEHLIITLPEHNIQKFIKFSLSFWLNTWPIKPTRSSPRAFFQMKGVLTPKNGGHLFASLWVTDIPELWVQTLISKGIK